MRVLGFKVAASFLVSYQDTFRGAFNSKDRPFLIWSLVFIEALFERGSMQQLSIGLVVVVFDVGGTLTQV